MQAVLERPEQASAAHHPLPRRASPPYQGPERRSAASQSARLHAWMLDEIDYGIVLLVDQHVQQMNFTARAELVAGHPLQLVGRELRARDPQDQALLAAALHDAERGLQKLVTLGPPAERVGVAVVPMGGAIDGGPRATLLKLGKRRVCQHLSVQWFARAHALTAAETRVLDALCEGLEPREVAEQHRVGMATVRTQIGSIRAKTGAESIRDLVRLIAVLPPMVSALRPA